DVFARPHRTSSPNTSVRGGAIKTPDQEQREQQLIQDKRLARFRQEWEENNSTTTGAAQVDHMVEQAAAAQLQQAVQDHEQQLVERKILDNVAASQAEFPFDPVTAPEVLAARAAENPANFGKTVGVLLSSHDGGKRSRREMPREDHANKPYNQESGQSFPRVLSLARVGAAGGGRAGEGSGEDHAEAGLQQELQQQHTRVEQDHASLSFDDVFSVVVNRRPEQEAQALDEENNRGANTTIAAAKGAAHAPPPRAMQDPILPDALQRDGSAAAGQDGAGGTASGGPTSSTANQGAQTQTMPVVPPPVVPPETGEEQEVGPRSTSPGPEGSLRIHAIIGGPDATHDATGQRIHSSPIIPEADSGGQSIEGHDQGPRDSGSSSGRRSGGSGGPG
ncbi:unnamed protein product, partial [Amoebophrya sp. A120]